MGTSSFAAGLLGAVSIGGCDCEVIGGGMVESRALEPLLDWEADAAWDEVAEEGGVCVVVVDAAVSGWLAWLCFMANFQAADMLRGLFFWASFCFCSSARARASASFLSIRSRFQGGRWAYFFIMIDMMLLRQLFLKFCYSGLEIFRLYTMFLRITETSIVMNCESL